MSVAKRKLSLLISVMVFVISMSLAFICMGNVVDATAATPYMIMQNGASARLGKNDDVNGLRFTTLVDKEFYDGLTATTVEVGTLIIPSDLLGENELTLESVQAKKTVLSQEKCTLGNFSDTHYSYGGVLVDIKDGNLMREYTGRGYILVDEGLETEAVYYAEQSDNSRSIAYVLSAYRASTETVLRSEFAGKKLSVLGDSISTYAGVSNDTSINNTLAYNEVWYDTELSRSDTWWQQAADRLNMQILVNNSWSGSSVSDSRNKENGADSAAWNIRCENLHSNTNGIINPDIIAFYMGANDFADNYPCNTSFDASYWTKVEENEFVPTTFDEAYAVTIYKITQKYTADIFCFTLPQSSRNTENAALKATYNNAIKAIAEHYGCSIVDLSDTKISTSYKDYTLDGLHPNQEGMDIITGAFLESLIRSAGEQHFDYAEQKIQTAFDRITLHDPDATLTLAINGKEVTDGETVPVDNSFDVTATFGGFDIAVTAEVTEGDLTVSKEENEVNRFNVDGMGSAVVRFCVNEESVELYMSRDSVDIVKSALFEVAQSWVGGVSNSDYNIESEYVTSVNGEQGNFIKNTVTFGKQGNGIFGIKLAEQPATYADLQTLLENNPDLHVKMTLFIDNNDVLHPEHDWVIVFENDISSPMFGVDDRANHSEFNDITYEYSQSVSLSQFISINYVDGVWQDKWLYTMSPSDQCREGSVLIFYLSIEIVEDEGTSPLLDMSAPEKTQLYVSQNWGLADGDFTFSSETATVVAGNEGEYIKAVAAFNKTGNTGLGIKTTPKYGYEYYSELAENNPNLFVDLFIYVDSSNCILNNGKTMGNWISSPMFGVNEKGGADNSYLKTYEYRQSISLSRWLAINYNASGVWNNLDMFTVAGNDTIQQNSELVIYISVQIGDPSQNMNNWGFGSIQSANGQEDLNNKARILYKQYLQVDDWSECKIGSGYQLLCFVYDADKNYLGRLTSDWMAAGTGFTTDEILSATEYYKANNVTSTGTPIYFRIIFRNISNSDMSAYAVEDIVKESGVTLLGKNSVRKLTYSGDKISVGNIEVTTNTFSMEPLTFLKAAQDGAVYGNYLFLFENNGICTVYDCSADFQIVADFVLDKAELISPHSNAVCFGSIYYDSSDLFPLLYTNVYNNYQNETDSKIGYCLVYRILKSGNTFSSELVQIIRIGFTENSNYWYSDGEVRPYGNFIVDTDKNKLYAFVMRNNKMTFLQFEVPALTEGEYDDTYRVNVVTLQLEDVLDKFDTEYFSYIQGAAYYDGKIYSLEGMTWTDVKLQVVDMAGKKVVSTIDFTENGYTDEPEMIFILDGNIYVQFLNDGFYKLIFY